MVTTDSPDAIEEMLWLAFFPRCHDPAVSNQCAEPQAEWVADKERANFCEYFVCADGGGPAKRSREGHSARERFNKLFRD